MQSAVLPSDGKVGIACAQLARWSGVRFQNVRAATTPKGVLRYMFQAPDGSTGRSGWKINRRQALL